jgi:glutamyl-tRNA synthetase
MDKAYYCFCDAERLEKLREEQIAAKKDEIGYDRHCRSLSKEEREHNIAEGKPYVIRLKIPLDGVTVFEDDLLGRIEWKNEDISPDPVLLKSDGFPTYHLANIIDDHLMGITHVMRAQEWIPSAPLHKIMYDAFGWEMPELCHLPMVLGQDGHKLSKRHGATAVNEFRKAGYLPEALINYIALLGCSYEDSRDIYSLDELVKLFKIERLNKAPAVFDYQKLEWFNGQYIRQKSDQAPVRPGPPISDRGRSPPERGPRKGPDGTGRDASCQREAEIPHGCPGDHGLPLQAARAPPVETYLPKKADAHAAVLFLEEDKRILQEFGLEDITSVEEKFRERALEIGKKLGDLLMPLRVAITYTRVSPPLFESMKILGLGESLERIEKAIQYLQGA